jgi:hypothetical protein
LTYKRNGQLRAPTDQTLKVLGGDHKESDAFNRDRCYRVRRIPEESHFSQQVALDEDPEDSLRAVDRPSRFHLALMNQIGLAVHGFPLPEDHISGFERPGGQGRDRASGPSLFHGGMVARMSAVNSWWLGKRRLVSHQLKCPPSEELRPLPFWLCSG